MGVQIGQTTIQLPERLVFFDPEVQNLADCHVRIEVGGKLLFGEKLKRDEARQHGVELGPDGVYFFERIVTQRA